MPTIALAVAAGYIGTAVSAYVGTTLALGAVAGALAGAVASTVVAYALGSAFGLNRPPGANPQASGALINAAAAYAPIPVIYGARRVGGTRVLTQVSSTNATVGANEGYVIPSGAPVRVAQAASFTGDLGVTSADGLNTTFTAVGSNPGPNQYTVAGGVYTFNASDAGRPVTIAYNYQASTQANNLLHLIVVWGEGPIQSIDTLYLDDVAITDPKFAGLVYSENYLGSDTQAASAHLQAMLPGQWTASDTLSGVAYTYVQLLWSREAFPRGMPTLTADVHGRTVFDPRSSTTGWSNNPALCIRDYLTSTRYGLKAPSSMIDDTTFIAAANHCEEAVSIPTASGTTTQNRYACVGVVNIDNTRLDNLTALLSSCRGFLVFSGGKYKLKNDKADTPVSFTLTEDNLVGGWKTQLAQKRQRYNRGIATFFDAANLWQQNAALFDSPIYRAQDSGELLTASVDLPFTPDVYRAQQIVQQVVQQSRLGAVVQVNATIAALQLEVGDVVPLTHSTPGWNGKLFRVLGVTLAANDEVALQLREYDATVYNLSAQTLQPASPATSLPNPNPAPPTRLQAFSGTAQLFIAGDGTVVSRVLVTWDPSTNIFVRAGGSVRVQWQRQGDTIWNEAQLRGDATQIFLQPVQDGQAYYIRVSFENSIARSAWTQIGHTVVGKTAPPSDVTNFTINGSTLSWSPVTDADLDGYRLRFQAGLSQSWGDAVWLHGQGGVQQDVLTSPPFTIPSNIGVGQATLMVKAVDTSGNESLDAAILVTNLGSPAIANAVQTFDRKASGFPGTKTNCAVDGSGNLAANSTTLMWGTNDAAAMWSADSTTLMWAASNFAAMTYEDRVVTAGARSGSKLTISAAIQGSPWTLQYRENSTKAMWSADGSTPMWASDSSTAMWDTPPYQAWPGSIIVFPDTMIDVLVTAGQGATQGKISGLTLTLDAPDISETLAKPKISSGGTRLPITKSYVAIKSVLPVVVSDGGTAVSAKQEDTQSTGPLVKTYDGTGTAVNGHVNARVEGY